MLAIAIRDAQELGMHRDAYDPKPKDNSLESVLENQWLVQMRRKTYMVLAIMYATTPPRADSVMLMDCLGIWVKR